MNNQPMYICPICGKISVCHYMDMKTRVQGVACVDCTNSKHYPVWVLPLRTPQMWTKEVGDYV
uniref:Uncharacterized protein n=1 Tax=viral metagenome TaxID=1070528 RepID=A0A6M3XUP4_9ZZZZ